MGSSAHQFYDIMRITKRIEQIIKMRKTKGPIMGFRTMIRDFITMSRDELEDGSQVENLSYVVQPNLVVASFAQVPLSKIDILLPLEFVSQHQSNSKFVALTPSNLIQPLFPRWYNPNERCEYHVGVLSYSIEIVRNSSITFRSW